MSEFHDLSRCQGLANSLVLAGLLLLTGAPVQAMSQALARVATAAKTTKTKAAAQAAAAGGAALATLYLAQTQTPAKAAESLTRTVNTRCLTPAKAAFAGVAPAMAVSLGWQSATALVKASVVAAADAATTSQVQCVYNRPSNRVHDYPAIFDEFKFEQVYTKWRQRLDAELAEIVAELDWLPEELEMFTNNLEAPVWQKCLAEIGKPVSNQDLPRKLDLAGRLRPDFNHADNVAFLEKEIAKLLKLDEKQSRQLLSAAKEAEIYDMLDQYGLSSRYILLASFKKEFTAGSSKNDLDNVQRYELNLNFDICKDLTTLACTVGHEATHILFDDWLHGVMLKLDDDMKAKPQLLQRYELFLEKRADIVSTLSGPNPLDSAYTRLISGIGFGSDPIAASYNYQISREWFELIQDLEQCYDQSALHRPAWLRRAVKKSTPGAIGLPVGIVTGEDENRLRAAAREMLPPAAVQELVDQTGCEPDFKFQTLQLRHDLKPLLRPLTRVVLHTGLKACATCPTAINYQAWSVVTAAARTLNATKRFTSTFVLGADQSQAQRAKPSNLAALLSPPVADRR